MFEVGDKVVCVSDSWRPMAHKLSAEIGTCLPTKGVVYVVRDVLVSPMSGALCVRLVGVQLPICPHYKMECAFNSNRFRKLSDIQAENKERRKQEKEFSANRKP